MYSYLNNFYNYKQIFTFSNLRINFHNRSFYAFDMQNAALDYPA